MKTLIEILKENQKTEYKDISGRIYRRIDKGKWMPTAKSFEIQKRGGQWVKRIDKGSWMPLGKKEVFIESNEKIDEAFIRLPGHVIGNELYDAKRWMEALYNNQTNGNDLDMRSLNNLIKLLQDIKKQAKKFNKPEDVPVSYQYKESTELDENLNEAAFNILALDKLIAKTVAKGDKKREVNSELENFYNAQPQKYNKRLTTNALFKEIHSALTS